MKMKRVLALQCIEARNDSWGWEENSTLSFLCNPISSYESVAKC